MLFNSYDFLFAFLPVTLLGFYALARRGDTRLVSIWLTAASLFFYGWWDVSFLALLVLSAIFNFAFGMKIGEARSKAWLLAGVAANLLLLGYFKYAGFFIGALNDLAGRTVILWPDVILPVGISFFTFTQTAYLVDVWRGGAREESFINYLEFVTIFPHLVAGPILSHREMAPQFSDEKNLRVNWQNVRIGILLFVSGLFKKTVIADSLAPWTNFVFENASSVTMAEAWIGAISYMFQIYFDFSGYSEMALGLGSMMNLSLPVNFDSPYRATSVIDFWRRWHISLGTWVKEYIYIPLGGRERGAARRAMNLFICMIFVGFWHGAGWTYLVWGLLQGVYLFINHGWRSLGLSMPVFLAWGLTFFGETISQTFFRANTVADGVTLVRAMTDFGHIVLPAGGWASAHLGFFGRLGVTFGSWHGELPPAECAAALFTLTLILLSVPNPVRLSQRMRPGATLALVAAALFVISLLYMTRPTEFLYFQF